MPLPNLLLVSTAVLGGSSEASSPSAVGPDLTRYLLISAGMIVLVGGLGWFLQRLVANSNLVRARRRSLRIVDVLPLGGKKKLAVVSVYDRTFVLGLGDKEVSVVSEIEVPTEPARELAPAQKPAGLAGAFESLRARVAEGRPKPQPAEVTARDEKRIAAAVGAREAKPRRAGLGRGLLG